MIWQESIKQVVNLRCECKSVDVERKIGIAIDSETVMISETRNVHHDDHIRLLFNIWHIHEKCLAGCLLTVASYFTYYLRNLKGSWKEYSIFAEGGEWKVLELLYLIYEIV